MIFSVHEKNCSGNWTKFGLKFIVQSFASHNLLLTELRILSTKPKLVLEAGCHNHRKKKLQKKTHMNIFRRNYNAQQSYPIFFFCFIALNFSKYKFIVFWQVWNKVCITTTNILVWFSIAKTQCSTQPS